MHDDAGEARKRLAEAAEDAVVGTVPRSSYAPSDIVISLAR